MVALIQREVSSSWASEIADRLVDDLEFTERHDLQQITEQDLDGVYKGGGLRMPQRRRLVATIKGNKSRVNSN